MSIEAIKLICAAEEEARRDKIEARLKAVEMIEDTERTCKETVSSTLKRAESELAHLIRAADHKATEHAVELASKTANRQAALRARAERRLGDAARLIIERIVKV